MYGWVRHDAGTRNEFEATIVNGEELGMVPDPIPLSSKWTGTLTASHRGQEPSVQTVTASVEVRTEDLFTIRIVCPAVPEWEWEYECAVSEGDHKIRKATLVSAPLGWEERPGEKLVDSSKVTVTKESLEIILSRPVAEGSRQAHFEFTRDE
jgi:hypothetical protein